MSRCFVVLILLVSTQTVFAQREVSASEAITLFNTYTKKTSACQAALDVLHTCEFLSSDEHLKFLRTIERQLINNSPTADCAYYFLETGRFYRAHDLFNESIEAYLISNSIIDQLGLWEERVYADLCDAIGHIYYFVGDYNKSLDFFQRWYDHPDRCPEFLYNTLNTIGLVYGKVGDLDSAEAYYVKAIEEAERDESWSWVGIVSGNLSEIYHRKGWHEKAMQLAEIDYNLSLEHHNYTSAALVLVHKADYYTKNDSLDVAYECLVEAKELFELDSDSGFFPPEFYQVRGNLFDKMGAYKLALADVKRFIEIRDSIRVIRDKAQLQNIEYRIYAQKKEGEIESLIEQRRNRTLFAWIISGVGLIFVLLLLRLIRQENIKRRKDREIQSIRRQLLNNRLNQAEENIGELLKGIKNRNSFIQQLTNELERAKSGDMIDAKSSERISKTLKERKILTEEDWVRFKNLFSEIYPYFFSSLIERHPSLTPAELRMAALIRLNLTNLEMATLLGISKDSVRKTILRLRNKMSIDTNEQLILFLMAL